MSVQSGELADSAMLAIPTGGPKVDDLPKVVPLDDQMGVFPKRNCPETLEPVLFPTDVETRCYAILDAALVPGLVERLAASDLPHRCLFKGEAEDTLGDVAPWLVELTETASLTRYLFTANDEEEPVASRLWGATPLFLVLSDLDLTAVWSHFRKFTKVQTAETGWSYFRFWEETVQIALCDLVVQEPVEVARFLTIVPGAPCCDLVFPNLSRCLRGGGVDDAMQRAASRVSPSQIAVSLQPRLRAARIEYDLRQLAAAILPDAANLGGRNRLISSLRMMPEFGIQNHAQLEELGRVEAASGFRFLGSAQAKAALSIGGYPAFVRLMHLAQREGLQDAAR